MASNLLHFRPKHRPLLRHFSSSSSNNNNNNNNQSRPSFFTDLKSSLKQPSQSQQPHRPSFFNSNPNPNSQKVASLDEIRKNLSEFRSRSAVTPPPPSSSSESPPISFQEMYQRNVMPKPDSGTGSGSGSEPVSLNAIRSSLKNMRTGSPPRLQLNEISESLKLRPNSANVANRAVSDETKTEFVRMYNYLDLGRRLKELRTVNDKKGSRKGNTFSLAELNERLKKLRELDEKEAQSNAGGFTYAQLRESLIKLNDDDKTKKSAAQRINVFAQLGGTPSFMLSPPKEELVEKYFHPDHMSSAEKQKLELKSVRDKFKISESDCGSSRVQVAQLTTKIKHLASVLHKKFLFGLKRKQRHCAVAVGVSGKMFTRSLYQLRNLRRSSGVLVRNSKSGLREGVVGALRPAFQDRCYASIPQPAASVSSLNQAELAKFAAIADSWWDAEGPFKPLHVMNPTRLAFIRSTLCRHFGKDPFSVRPFEGLKFVDVGCGGGILSEPLARMGASVTGVDAVDKNIKIARLHADLDPVTSSIDYRCTTAENLVEEQKQFDAVLALEVIEHVADPAEFCKSLSALTVSNGTTVISTINRSMRAYATAIVVAEYILHWLPKGTHQWSSFLTPEELVLTLQRASISVKEMAGFAYNPMTGQWSLTDDIGVNFIAFGIKKSE